MSAGRIAAVSTAWRPGASQDVTASIAVTQRAASVMFLAFSSPRVLFVTVSHQSGRF